MNLRDVIYGKKRERLYTETTMIGGIVCPLLKMNDWDVYIYGAGNDIDEVVLYFWGLGIQIKGIFDSDEKKSGGGVMDEVPIIYPNGVQNKFDPEKTFVIINTGYFQGIEQCEIINTLGRLGIKKFYSINDSEREQIKVQQIWSNTNRITFYREHIDEMEMAYHLLYDKKSKEIMTEFVRAYMEIGAYSLKQCNGSFKYFWGEGEDGSKEKLYRHLEDEVWINCGSCNGDTIFWYFANELMAKSVYAYEADELTYISLRKNLQYLPSEFREKVHPINEFINEKTNWSILNGEKVTLINADIEGGELDLLKSMKDIITLHRPVLAICAYHRADDLIEIPKYIEKITKGYKFVLRKYEASALNVRRVSELVLYAIPEERLEF